MLTLPNGCSCSEVAIFPTNWKSSKADMTLTWAINFRFKDPRYIDKFPNGKSIRIKAGINRLKDRNEKQGAVEYLRDEIVGRLKAGFNYFTDVGEKLVERLAEIAAETSTLVEDKVITAVEPHTPFIKAFRFALTKSQNVKESKADAKSGLNSLEAAAIKLDFHEIPISEIQVKHIKLCLDECMNSSTTFSAKRFNKVKSYLSGLFKYLVEVGATSGNMAKAISPMKTDDGDGESAQVVLTVEEIKLVKERLWNYNRPFYNFMMMFYYSGGRIKEFMRLKGRNVDLVEQTYKVNVEKGKSRMVTRTIRTVALPFWRLQMENCAPGDFVFSKDLLPGPIQINSKQVSRRWMTHVKEPLGIVPTFYKLKHLNTDRTLAAAGAKVAAGQNAHLTTKMVEEVYAFNEKKRIHDTLKNLDIEL